MPAPRFNQYNVIALQTSAYSLRPIFARALKDTFGSDVLGILGTVPADFGKTCEKLELKVWLAANVQELEGMPAVETVVWIYPERADEDEAVAGALAQVARQVVLVSERSADIAKRRPALVAAFGTVGLMPDYERDLTALEDGALMLTRAPVADGARLVAQVETAMARMQKRMRSLERTLRTRMTELDAADRHIGQLEEKLLKLKEYRRSIKQLKEEKQTLRKAPERRVGQVLLAPYLLPQKLLRGVRKRWPQGKGKSGKKTDYEKWFDGQRFQSADQPRLRAEADAFTYRPCVSIITPVFNTPVEWLRDAVDSVLAQVWEDWELILVNDNSTDPALLAYLPELESAR